MRAALVFCLGLLIGGCAAYVNNLRTVDHALVANNPGAALAALEPLADGRSRALYLLDKAMILRMQGRYADSIQVFESVKPLLSYLEATSVSETAAALTLNENLRSYTPPLFERLLLHVYQSLNYIQSGDREAARVEIRQIDVLLGRLYPNNRATPDGSEAFARYFAGLLYQDDGHWDAARIAWRRAYQAYRRADREVPRSLEVSLCRAARRLGLARERAAYEKRFGQAICPAKTNSSKASFGQVVLVLSNGLAPRKIAITQLVQSPSNLHSYSISLPDLRRRPPVARTALVSIGGKTTPTRLVESIARQSQRVLDANRPGLIGAQLARDVARGAVAHRADKAQPGLGALFSFAASVADRADTRAWNVLPDNIQLARIRLAPGRYDMQVTLQGGAGQPGAIKNFARVKVRPHRITFVTWHAIGNAGARRRSRRTISWH